MKKLDSIKLNLEQVINFQSDENNRETLINILNLIASICPTSKFKVIVLTELINQVVLNNQNIIKKLTSQQIEILFQCCEIKKLDSTSYFYNGDKYDSIFSLWKFMILRLLEFTLELDDELLMKNLLTIQKFFMYTYFLYIFFNL